MKLPFFPQKEKPEISAQETIPIERIYPDGTVKSKGAGEKAVYSRSVRFHDRNYALEGEGKKTILEAWGRIFNLFDQTVHLQFTYITDKSTKNSAVLWGLPDNGDVFDSLRYEYTEIVQKQIASGRGITNRDYLMTFSVKGESYASVKEKLERVGQMVLVGFRKAGVSAEQLNGQKQTELLYGIFHIGMPRMTIRETDKFRGCHEFHRHGGSDAAHCTFR